MDGAFAAGNKIMSVFNSAEEFAVARDNMVFGQLIPNRIRNAAVLQAMDAVPREIFLPDPLKSRAYADETLVAGGGLFFSPQITAALLVAADAGRNDFVLNPKAGTGYTTAVLAQTARAVVGLEPDPDRAAAADSLLAENGVDNAAVLCGTAEEGFPRQAPFDVIFIGGTVPVIGEDLLSQLGEKGRLVAVEVNPGNSFGTAVKIVRAKEGFKKTTLFSVDLSAFDKLFAYKKFDFETIS